MPYNIEWEYNWKQWLTDTKQCEYIGCGSKKWVPVVCGWVAVLSVSVGCKQYPLSLNQRISGKLMSEWAIITQKLKQVLGSRWVIIPLHVRTIYQHSWCENECSVRWLCVSYSPGVHISCHPHPVPTVQCPSCPLGRLSNLARKKGCTLGQYRKKNQRSRHRMRVQNTVWWSEHRT